MTEIPPSPAGEPPADASTVLPTTIVGGLSRNVAAGLACLFSIVSGIIFLVLERRDRFVRFWAMQAVFLGGLALAVAVVVKIAVLLLVILPLIGGLLVLLLGVLHIIFTIAWLVAYVVSVIKAFSGQEWEIPWLGKLARKQLDDMDLRMAPPATP